MAPAARPGESPLGTRRAVVSRVIGAISDGSLARDTVLLLDRLDSLHEVSAITGVGRDGFDGHQELTRLVGRDLQLAPLEEAHPAVMSVSHLGIGHADDAAIGHALAKLRIALFVSCHIVAQDLGQQPRSGSHLVVISLLGRQIQHGLGILH